MCWSVYLVLLFIGSTSIQANVHFESESDWENYRDSFVWNPLDQRNPRQVDYEGSGDYGDDEDDDEISVVRLAILIDSPWAATSQIFSTVSMQLKDDIKEFLADINEFQADITMLKFNPTSQKDETMVLMDFSTRSDDVTLDVVKRRLENAMKNSVKIGTYYLQPASENWWRPIDGDSPSSPCSITELTCVSGQCVPITSRCNGIEECGDGSDELQCSNDPIFSLPNDDGRPEYWDQNCNFGQHECDDGACVDNALVCNGIVDCPSDDSDEANCVAEGIVPKPSPQPVGCRADTQIVCPDGNTRICEVQRCDGVENCPKDPESTVKSWDEEGCIPFSDVTFVPPIDSTTSPSVPKFEVVIDPVEISTSIGKTVTFTCTVDPLILLETVSISWSRKDANGQETFLTSMRTLTIANVQAYDQGQYICKGESSGVISTVTGTIEIIKCTFDQYICNDLSCIDSSRKCDKVKDCPTGEDEENCPCLEPDHLCGDGACYDSKRVCDGILDCSDGSDESNCVPECGLDEFQCLDDSCILLSYMCDGKDDCANGEDEMGCPAQTTPTSTTTTSTTTTETVVKCNENEYLCPSVNACFSKCNTALICPDVPKEVHCPDCPEFKCQYSGLCISSASVCNGVMDCPQNEDEENCCRPGQFQCGNGLCVDKDAICDGKYDCIDAADERDCNICKDYEFQCESGQCIPKNLRCNGNRDCPDGTDELDCQGCKPDEFACLDGKQCISIGKKCDKRQDCFDGSDESDCPFSCQANEFMCNNGRECIPSRLRCDDTIQCSDGSDELGCPSIPSNLNLMVKIYPTEQTIEEGGEVVFQCRDEGPLRARVSWSRSGGLAMPDRSFNYEGRLTIPNSQVLKQSLKKYIRSLL